MRTFIKNIIYKSSIRKMLLLMFLLMIIINIVFLPNKGHQTHAHPDVELYSVDI